MENLETKTQETTTDGDILPELLAGFRFSVCETPQDFADALEVRRQVYCDDVGYDVPVLDALDARSWLLIARDESTGKAVGTMRLTPRFAGSFELEEYFTLPKTLRGPRSVELNRFAILPEYRKGKTFFPVVSLGLFKLVLRFLKSQGSHHLVIASKAERIWTYEWLRFKRTGVTAMYGALDAIEHELLTFDFRAEDEILGNHPFARFFHGIDYREVILPATLPALGLGIEQDEEPMRAVA